VATQFSIAPQEKLSLNDTKKGKLFIGIPSEKSFQEKRIALTPESVMVLTSRGHRVLVQTKAGQDSRFTDMDYSEAGAQIVYETKDVFAADIVVKATPPNMIELEHYKPCQTIISPIHLPTLNHEIVEALIQKKIIGLAFEYIKDDSGAFPIVQAMSEIAGNQSITIAADLLSNVNNGLGVMLGGLSGVAPTQVVILGSGTVAEFAARTAIGMGASVKVFDNSLYKLKRLQNNLGQRIFTSVLYPDVLLHELQNADVVIGAVHSQEGRTPVLVSEEMVSKMKPGAVIVDVSIDQGGCFETSEVCTHNNPVFIKYDVVHYCVPNIASRVARTASYAISSVLTPLITKASDYQGIENYIRIAPSARNGVYLFNGAVTNQYIADHFNLRFSDMQILLGGDY
jgi:alanine dehydrogenase